MNLNRATLLGSTAIFWWSLPPLFISYTTAFPPFLAAALILGFGFLIFCLRWAVTRAPVTAYVRQPFRVWALGFYGITLYMVLFASGLKLAPIAEANLCNYIWPAVIVILSVLLDRQSLRWFHAAGIGLSLLGLFVLLGWRSGPGFAFHCRLGHVLALLGGIVWGTYSVLGRKFSHVDSNVTGIFFGMGAIALLVLSMVTEDRPPFTSADLWPFLGCGVCSHFGYYSWDIGMKKGDRLLLGVVSYLIPVLSTLWLLLFGRASATGSLWLAILLVFSGAVVAGLDRLLQWRPCTGAETGQDGGARSAEPGKN